MVRTQSVRSGWLFVLGLALTLGLVGCGGRQGRKIEGETNIQNAARLYMRYLQANKMRGPSSEKELIDYIKKIPKSDLEQMQIEDVDAALKSPRDGQPYGFVLTIDPSMMMGGRPKGKVSNKELQTKPPVIVYERQGSGGKRYVAFMLGGGFSEVDEETFQELVPGAK